MHWGTFTLAMHAWDQPAEALRELGSRANVRLLMPKLGEPVEPTRIDRRIDPWWRAVEPSGKAVAPIEDKLPDEVPFPLD